MTHDQRPWTRFYDPQTPVGLDYEIRPVFEFLDRAARRWPGRPAVIFKNYRLSYADLKRHTEILAANLAARGLERGDRVAVMLPNCPQTIISYWGVLRAGGVAVMTNPLYMETELVRQLNDSGARFMITMDALWKKLAPLLDRLPVEAYFLTRLAEGLGFPLNLLYDLRQRRSRSVPRVCFDNRRVLPWKALARGRARHTRRDLDPDQDMALLQYTGGTTGLAKGCEITHANLAANMQQCAAMLHALGEEREIVLGVMPYFHIYGLTVCLNLPALIGAAVVPFPRYAPKDVLAAIHRIRPTVFPGAPALYGSLLEQKDLAEYDLSSIAYCVSGSAPMPLDTAARFKELTGAEIVEGYGLTEASPVTHLNPLKGVKKPGSIGIPFPDTEAKIVDMELGEAALAPGKIGELVIRGPQVMRGYHNRPDETANALRNGWLYTGDIAYMDQDGYFFIVDRKKDLVISGGQNIYPREIDEVLLGHPGIKEAVAVGVPHPIRGEVIKAYVVPRPGACLTKAEVIRHCRLKLAHYKVPRSVEFRDGLPTNMVGKVLRRALRAEEELSG
ncbi:MAG: long-chain fatty acid--CoA ligase [Desulfovibrionaceae bacterium]|nr:long-chain fatty acid--CoA ligase [Desulfovibrionaceae bacterium]